MSIRNGREAYKSPIETIWSDIEYDYGEQFDQMVLTAVQSVGITVNKEELVKALAYDREQYRKGWEDRDSKIVRCWDCQYWEPATLSSGNCGRAFDITAYKDDYCSYGERRTNAED